MVPYNIVPNQRHNCADMGEGDKKILHQSVANDEKNKFTDIALAKLLCEAMLKA